MNLEGALPSSVDIEFDLGGADKGCGEDVHVRRACIILISCSQLGEFLMCGGIERWTQSAKYLIEGARGGRR